MLIHIAGILLNDANTISSPLLFAHYFEEKVGRGIWSNIQFVSSRNFNMHGVKNHDNCFLEEWHELKEISSTCVDTNPRGIKATFIVSGDRGTTLRKFAFQVRATKALVVASQQGCSKFCVYMFTNTTDNGTKP